MTDQASIIEDFWLTIARNDRAVAEAAATQIKAPLVSVLASYSFELVEGEDGQAEMGEEHAGTLTGSPRAVMPDTPVVMVNAWNAEVGVSLIVVSKSKTCGARVSDGEVDFIACAGAMDCPGGGGCGWTTNELGGKDSKKRMVMKMDLPDRGEAYAILVRTLGSSVQHPKVFLLPILLKTDLPFPETIKWDLPLLSFNFKTRERKLFIKAYQGSSWFALVWSHAIKRGGLEDQPSTLEIPSPRIGKGGYSSEEFLDESPSDRSLKSGQEELPPKTLGGTDLFASRLPVSVQ
jgi:hypothetical protein